MSGPADDPAARHWTWSPAPGVAAALGLIDEMLSATTTLDRLRPEEWRTAAAMASWRAREHLAGRALLLLRPPWK
ncbi:hypothetical protein ACWGIV_34980 [Streptomyces sp. NPDC054844]